MKRFSLISFLILLVILAYSWLSDEGGSLQSVTITGGPANGKLQVGEITTYTITLTLDGPALPSTMGQLFGALIGQTYGVVLVEADYNYDDILQEGTITIPYNQTTGSIDFDVRCITLNQLDGPSPPEHTGGEVRPGNQSDEEPSNQLRAEASFLATESELVILECVAPTETDLFPAPPPPFLEPAEPTQACPERACVIDEERTVTVDGACPIECTLSALAVFPKMNDIRFLTNRFATLNACNEIDHCRCRSSNYAEHVGNCGTIH